MKTRLIFSSSPLCYPFPLSPSPSCLHPSILSLHTFITALLFPSHHQKLVKHSLLNRSAISVHSILKPCASTVPFFSFPYFHRRLTVPLPSPITRHRSFPSPQCLHRSVFPCHTSFTASHFPSLHPKLSSNIPALTALLSLYSVSLSMISLSFYLFLDTLLSSFRSSPHFLTYNSAV